VASRPCLPSARWPFGDRVAWRRRHQRDAEDREQDPSNRPCDKEAKKCEPEDHRGCERHRDANEIRLHPPVRNVEASSHRREPSTFPVAGVIRVCLDMRSVPSTWEASLEIRPRRRTAHGANGGDEWPIGRRIGRPRLRRRPSSVAQEALPKVLMPLVRHELRHAR
jgi:hypothetical protein